MDDSYIPPFPRYLTFVFKRFKQTVLMLGVNVLHVPNFLGTVDVSLSSKTLRVYDMGCPTSIMYPTHVIPDGQECELLISESLGLEFLSSPPAPRAVLSFVVRL